MAKSVSPSQTFDKKIPSSSLCAAPAPTPPADNNDIYTFDHLPTPPQVPRKPSNSSNVKEDLQHIQYKSKQQIKPEDIYTFDRLDTSKLQQRVQRQPKTAYDSVPFPVARSKSPSPPDDQEEEYIEPIDENVLKDIKESHAYDKLSAVMVGLTLNHSPVAEQQPPQLPTKKKKTENRGLDSPVKPSPIAAVGQPSSHTYREPLSPVKVAIP